MIWITTTDNIHLENGKMHIFNNGNVIQLIEINAPNFWYLHGKLEKHFHYDKARMFISTDLVETMCEKYECIYSRKGEEYRETYLYLKEGIYDVEVYGVPTKCTAYIWHRNYNNFTDLRGLVVMNNDKDAIKYAEDMYNNKSTRL